jgi:hypothetical protein
MLDMRIRPSDLLGLKDAYTAFCFDEACAFIVHQLQEGKEPIIKHQVGGELNIHASKPSDIYRRFS